MWALIYAADYGEHKAGDIHLVSRGEFSPERHKMDVLQHVEIPEQDISQLPLDSSYSIIGTIDDLVQYSQEERSSLVDRDTGEAITLAVHPFCGTDESIGILRDQIVHILNGDMTATEDFKCLNKIAIAAIEKATTIKAAITDA